MMELESESVQSVSVQCAMGARHRVEPIVSNTFSNIFVRTMDGSGQRGRGGPKMKFSRHGNIKCTKIT